MTEKTYIQRIKDFEPLKVEHISVWSDDFTHYTGYLIREEHSHADIARLIIDQGWEDEILELLNDQEFVANGEK